MLFKTATISRPLQTEAFGQNDLFARHLVDHPDSFARFPPTISYMATGFEVVGVILGVIPLVIEGVRAYKRSQKGMNRTFNTLILEIETEETILRELFEGLRDEAEIAWDREGRIEEKVDLLLGDCSESFTRTAQSMNETIEELKEKLGMNPHGQKVSHKC
ncbi:hypothetical protein PG984_009118 [Apiospora sp. TS-2023a]